MRRFHWQQTLTPALAMTTLLGLLIEPSQLHASSDPYRLDHTVEPLKQQLELNLDARTPDYSGVAKIDLRVNSATPHFRLHARDLSLVSMTLTSSRGPQPVTYQQGQGDLVTITAAQPLPPGSYQLEIQFKNDFNRKAISLYKVETGGEAYVFSQFQAMFAREAFPCFDEPSFKIPWQIVMRVPEQHMAVSNNPPQSERVEKGIREVKFVETPPMPSYLLAFASGPLESVPIPGTSIPARVITVKGNTQLATDAIRVTPEILKWLETWFDRKYPYAKLDLIAAPEFMYGAMENPGAIVFRESRLLMDSARTSEHEKLQTYETLAHELAHIWFGDWVTMAWWDDLWLNESFASWMATKTIQSLYPQFNLEVHSVWTGIEAQDVDGRLSSRPIRREVPARQEALQDIGLHYSKGETILSMFEGWLGPDAFRKGVLTHLEAHAWGNATSEQLFEAFEKAGGRQVVDPMETFVERPGSPLITLTPGKGNRVTLSQSRILPLGQKDPNAGPWQVPLRIRYSDGKKVLKHSHLLKSASEELVLPGVDRLAWVMLSDGEQGYYRWQVPSDMLQALLAEPNGLSPRERVALVSHLAALNRAGLYPVDQLMATLEKLSKIDEPALQIALVQQTEELYFAYVLGIPEREQQFRVWLGRLLSPQAKALGWNVPADEPFERTRLRPAVLRMLGRYGWDAQVLAEATRLADVWLKDPSTLAPELGDVVIELSAVKGDRARFDAYKKRFEQPQTPQERQLFLSSLARFQDPMLLKEALAYVLTGPLRPQEMGTILFSARNSRERAQQVSTWLEQNIDTLMSRISPEFATFLPWLTVGCSLEDYRKTEPFLLRAAEKAPGMSRVIGEVQEATQTCETLRKLNGPALEVYFKRAGK